MKSRLLARNVKQLLRWPQPFVLAARRGSARRSPPSAAQARALRSIGDDGAVPHQTLHSLRPAGPGELILDHDAGLAAAWVENDEKSPWPTATPRAVAPPQSVALDGQAMTLALSPEAPILLNGRSNAPVILALDQGGAAGDPVLYPAGGASCSLCRRGAQRSSASSPSDGALSGRAGSRSEPPHSRDRRRRRSAR